MVYEPKTYDDLLGTAGFSDQLLKNHFTLYQGYVTNTNKLLEALSVVEKGAPAYAELKRRFGWEFNGMRLHELYFSNMTRRSEPLAPESLLAQRIVNGFGSLEVWENDFKATGALRGIGWAVLYYDPAAGRCFNTWVNEHDVGHLAGCTPLLIMDVFEHAFMLDYGLKRADYIEAFMKAVDWTVVGERFS